MGMRILTLSHFLTLLACLGLSTEAQSTTPVKAGCTGVGSIEATLAKKNKAQNRFIKMKEMSDGNLKVTEGRARLKVRLSRVRRLAAGFDCDPAAEGHRLIRSV